MSKSKTQSIFSLTQVGAALLALIADLILIIDVAYTHRLPALLHWVLFLSVIVIILGIAANHFLLGFLKSKLRQL